MGWAHRKVTTGALLRNWVVVYIGNFIGSVCIAVLGYWSGFMHMGGDAVADTAIKIAEGKVALPFDTAFVRDIIFCVADYRVLDGEGSELIAVTDNHQTRRVHTLPEALTTDSLRIEITRPHSDVPAALFAVRLFG